MAERLVAGMKWEPVYLTAREVCGLARIHRSTLSRWVKAGLVHATRVGGVVRYRKLDVEMMFGHNLEEGGR